LDVATTRPFGLCRDMRLCFAFLALLSILSPAPGAHAADAVLCPGLFAGGQPPALLNPKLASRTHGLCYDAYAVLASGVTRGPLWSAEHPTRASLEAARGTRRVNLFHTEDALPPGDRAELTDYLRSGYDRGHMTPSGDMPTIRAQQQSFSLANVVPQASVLNRGLWEHIESTTRRRAERAGELYVVTGPVFQGGELQQIGAGVLVPPATFKAIYDPQMNTAGAYVCANTDQPECCTVSVTELALMTGIDPFPAVAPEIKAAVPRLPLPRVRAGRQSAMWGP
jgi:endonuclease G, mitochondrial